jgi:hypothetical protein
LRHQITLETELTIRRIALRKKARPPAIALDEG